MWFKFNFDDNSLKELEALESLVGGFRAIQWKNSCIEFIPNKLFNAKILLQ